jgi:TolB protein
VVGVIFAGAAAGFGQAGADRAGALGIFEGQTDVGKVSPAGTAKFDAATGVYTIAASGANLWSTTDGFHFVWKKVSGDFSLTADVQLGEAGTASNPHRKALVMFRQTLDADSVYADAAVHGSGETALQYRRNKGDTTQDIAFNLGAPKTVRLVKRGDTITLFVSMKGEPLHPSGASIKLHFDEPFYVGLGVCAHQDGAVEKATFSNVALKPLEAVTSPPQTAALYSTLQTIAIDNNSRMAYVIVTGPEKIEAPNWSRDGKTLIFNRDGRLWTVPVAGGEPSAIDIGDAKECNGSHGLSPDGKWLAITCTTEEHPGRRVYIVPAGGGAPRMLTEPNSYFHSWSPDGKTILFARPEHGSINIFAIPAEGGDEKALTTGTGVSDDPDFSADGQYIYFNSDRAGGMQIFRMRPDGSQPEQMTFDEHANWTAHPSPDGKSVLILSYANGVKGHPVNQDVTLRILDVATKKVRDLVEIVGGGGSDNVPNWAPDGQHFAFVSYEMLAPEE